jgi:hypothetical protein
MIEKALDITRKTRSNFIKLLDGLTIAQLNKIPEGYSNNLAWNFGHIVISQQMICYVKGEIVEQLDEKFNTQYIAGGRPEYFIEDSELEFLKNEAFALIDKLEADLDSGVLDSYKGYLTRFGVEINTVQDAILYSMGHDKLHLGYALAMKKLV